MAKRSSASDVIIDLSSDQELDNEAKETPDLFETAAGSVDLAFQASVNQHGDRMTEAQEQVNFDVDASFLLQPVAKHDHEISAAERR